MAVPSTIADLDTVAANNSPSGSESIGTNLDDYLRSHAAIIKQVDNSKLSSSSLAASSGATLVGYMPSGTGAVATIVQAKLREFVSVKDFGAVGDGVADDTAAIQAAIDAGKTYLTTTSGREIYFPAGRYKVTTIDITDCHGVHLVGAGAYATEIFTSGTNQVIKAIGSSSTPLNKAGVKNMTIRGGGKTNASAHGIDLQWANTCYLENLVFFGCRNALNLAHQWQTSLVNISVTGVGADQSYIGVYMDATDLTYIDNAVQAVNVFVQGTSGYGFRLINAQGSKFTNCEAGGSPMVNAWYVGDPASGTVKCQWVHFSNCLGDSTSSAAWLFRQGAASELSQIQLSNCWGGNGDNGFYFDGCTYISATNLLAIGNTNSGIRLVNSSYNTINGCQCRANNEAASASVGDIHLNGSTYNSFVSNICDSNAAGKGYYEEGSTNSNSIIANMLFKGATISGANTHLYRNLGFKSENFGSAQITAAATSVTVSHGLGITPSIDNVSVTPRSDIGSASKFWVTNATATTFDINVNTTPGATITFRWSVDTTRIA